MSPEELQGVNGGPTGTDRICQLVQSTLSPKEGEQVEEGLPEGTAAVPKGTEPNMSALAGSV